MLRTVLTLALTAALAAVPATALASPADSVQVTCDRAEGPRPLWNCLNQCFALQGFQSAELTECTSRTAETITCTCTTL